MLSDVSEFENYENLPLGLNVFFHKQYSYEISVCGSKKYFKIIMYL